MRKNKLLLLIVSAACLAGAIVAGVLAVVFTASNHSQDPTDARESVVFIVETPADGSGSQYIGSGFFVGKAGEDPQYIITNAHVVADVQQYGGYLDVVFSGSNNDYATPEVIAYVPSSDHAILKLSEPTNKRKPLALLRAEHVVEGEDVVALGYPGVSSQIDNVPRYDMNDITMTRGIVSKKTTTDATGSGVAVPVYQIDAAINGGNSGGPLVDSQGRAIGVNTWGSTSTETLNWSIQINELLNTLNSKEVPYTLASDHATWLLVVLYVLAGLFLVGFGLFGFWWLKAGKAAPGAVGPAAVDAKGAPVARIGGKAPVMRGVTGKFTGAKFDLTEKVNIGRDASRSNVVFDPSVPGISALHCSVSFDKQSGRFMLVDHGSTYGTFLGNGQKVAPNVPAYLVAGDTFYLADRNNSFVLGLE